MTPETFTEARMQVARYYSNRDVRLERVNRPSIDDGEVLVRVIACGICGSDVMEWFRLPKSPRILGHEIAGIVEESRSPHYSVGERVVVRNQIPCGVCHACESGHHGVCENSEEIEPGGMAEFIRLPGRVVERGVSRLPPTLPFRAGALAEPVACVLHSQALARIEPRHCVVVIGCGVFGLLHIQVAKHAGVSRVVAADKIAYRTKAATKLGASAVVCGNEDLAAGVRKINDGRLADVAIVATGSPGGLQAACKAVGRCGTILLFGAPPPTVPFDMSLNELFWRKELTLVSSYGPGNVPFSEPLRLMEIGAIDVDALITDCVPFAAVQRGFDTVARAGESLKVVLEFDRVP